MFKRNKSSITQTLSGASYSLSVSGKRSKLGIVLVFSILAGLAFFVLSPKQVSPEVALRAHVEALGRDNQRLADELKQQTMSFQHEQATREALERQLATQAEELKKARKDLSFYRGSAVSQVQ